MINIYALVDPNTEEIRYVGKTILGLHKRLCMHRNERHHTYKCHWVESLKKIGLEPKIINLVSLPNNSDWEPVEQMFIVAFRGLGFRLTNIAGGGGGPTGIVRSEEFKQNVSNGMKLHYQQPGGAVTKQQISQSMKNYFAGLSDGKREELRLARLGRKQSMETRRKISKTESGKKVSKETRKKISKAGLGRKLSPEAIENIRLGHIGLKHTEEAKRKISRTRRFRTAVRKLKVDIG